MTAQEVVTVIQQMRPQARSQDAAPDLALIETTLREILRQARAEALGPYLTAAQETPVASYRVRVAARCTINGVAPPWC